MKLLISPNKKIASRHMTVAAESIAAACFALTGFDVLERAGQARFAYDLAVARAGGMMKLSVHASDGGFWNLVDKYIDRTAQATDTTYHRAIELWLKRHSAHVVCCLVQFDDADFTRMPRVYLASAREVAEKLHQAVDQLRDSALYEEYEITAADGQHVVRALPNDWRFSSERIARLMAEAAVPRHVSEASARVVAA